MPKIDVYTASTKPAVPNPRSQILETGEWRGAPLLAQTTKFAESLGQIAGTIQAQRDERTADERIAAWKLGEATIHRGLTQADPNDPNAVLPDLKDVESEYSKQMRELSKVATTGLSSPGWKGRTSSSDHDG